MTSEQLDFLANCDGPIEVGAVATAHPHSSKEYVEWMAKVWKANDERNKLIENTKKAKSVRAKHSRGVNPRVA